MVSRVTNPNADHVRNVDDTYKTWTQELAEVDGDLTTANGVTLKVVAPDGSVAVSDVSVTVDDADTVSYQFAAGDLTQPGGHKATFDVDFSGKTRVVPAAGHYDVHVTPAIDS